MKLFLVDVPQPLQPAVKACRRHIGLAAGFSALVNILYLAPTIYMMQVYDRVVPTAGTLTLVWLTVIVAVALATLTALDGVRARIMMRASLRLNRLLAGTIMERLLGRGGNAQGTTQAMREFDTLRQALGGQAMMAVFDTPWTPIYFLVAFMIHPVLGIMVLVGIAILVALALFNERRTKPLSERAHAANAQAYAHQEVVVGQAEIIRALGMRRSLVARQLAERRIGLEAATEVQFTGSRYNSTVKFFRMFMQSAALGAGAWLAIQGQISVGAIIAASVLLNRALQPIEQLVAQWASITQARQSLVSLATLFDNTADNHQERTTLPPPVGAVELDHVVVRNPEGSAVLLRNVCCQVEPGEVLGVIGSSGAGKTTLARIVAGAIAPDLGEIRIDGARYDDWDSELLARHIGYLPQDSRLLPGTVTENISRFCGSEEAGFPVDEAVMEAARQAGVHDLILRLPAGYDTMIGEKHHRLSAGQAQRIALARAFFRKPRLIVLDEPNSALDAEGEQALIRGIAAAKLNGAAIMIVAHRAAILANAEKLLVLDDGAVADFGSREDVMGRLRARMEQETVVPMKDPKKERRNA